MYYKTNVVFDQSICYHRLTKQFLVCLVVSAILVFTNAIHAQEPDLTSITQIEYEKVNPSDGTAKYGLKWLKEKILLFVLTLAPNKKSEYYEEIVGARLAELKYIVDTDDRNQIEEGSQRYHTHVGEYANFINNRKLDSTRAIKILESHNPVLSKLAEKYDTTTAEWRFIKHDIDYLQIYKTSLPS